ncbi:uncharacterized protein LOC135195048 [Macrobrachium nipponense]|uniref:uncharacterized protein LOC135195048 n=1 Tax=Macrobrachium nipponense TaxID=159736 RepID=UPI0030C7B0CA
MALHQFKIKHYATSGRHENPVNDSLENDNTHTSSTKQGDNNTPILRIQRRSSDPILLYKPSEVMVCPVQPYKDEEEEEGEEDLFRACHNDLIRDMKSNYDASQSHSSNAIVAEQYYEVKQKYPKKRTELPLQEVHADSIVRPTHHSHRAERGPLRENEHKEMLPCHSPHNVHSYQNSDIHFYPNHESPSPSWNETSPFACYSSQEPLEVEKLQYFYHQMATHMQPPIICPVTGHHFPVHLLKTLKGVHHSSNSIGEFLPQASAFVHSPNYEFENAKRMLVEGVKLVCDGARETMDKMEFKNKTRMSYNGGIPGVECIPSLDGSYQDICGKLNYIQSAFLQLAECNDPEMLNEARRIIPIDLLHRLLQQLQEHSLEGQEPQGIT